MEIVVFAVVLAAVFALKALAIVRGHEKIVADSASFSWTSARPEDAEKAANWADEQPIELPEARVALGGMRRVGGAGA